MFVTAQDEPPAPQFLYRDENRLVLVNGYTGEATELPLDVADDDRFEWSPDGQYLLTRLDDSETHLYCLNLYDVDAQEWAYEEPISCAVRQSIFSADGAQIVYSTSEETNMTLWLYSLEEETSEELDQTTGGNEINVSGISDIRWSPTKTYLSFEKFYWVLGGADNIFVVMNMKSRNYISISAPNSYYAFYDPIWSPDDSWFLITLKEEYVTNGALPRTNHLGDVYLVNTETGEWHRLTYTPAASEQDVRWTDDGNIAFTMVINQEMTFTLEQAMNVEAVSSEAIVTPEPIDVEDYYDPLRDVIISPDPYLGAWVSSMWTEQGNRIYELNIGDVSSRYRHANFSTPIPESYQYLQTQIGWRPSDYVYPLG
jgi:Tol biopolymer transport system component